MNSPRINDKTIITLTLSAIILVLSISLITPALSKKPNTLPDNSNDEINNTTAGIEIYWDDKGTNRVTSLQWGSLEPGADKEVTIFIKNKGKNPITLSYYASNWQTPEVADCLSLTWNYKGQTINFKEIFQVTFTLHVAENAEKAENFGFDITIISNQ